MGPDKNVERRRRERKRQRLPVRYWDPHDPRTFTGILVDESASGAFIETKDFLPLRSRIRIEGPGLVLHARVLRVCWIAPDDRPRRPGGMAVELLDRRGDVSEAEIEDESGHKLLVLERAAL